MSNLWPQLINVPNKPTQVQKSSAKHFLILCMVMWSQKWHRHIQYISLVFTDY